MDEQTRRLGIHIMRILAVANTVTMVPLACVLYGRALHEAVSCSTQSVSDSALATFMVFMAVFTAAVFAYFRLWRKDGDPARLAA